MKFKDLTCGDIFVPLAIGKAYIFRKTFDGKVEEVRGYDHSGKLISRSSKTVVLLEQEVQLIDQVSITGKPRR